MMNEMLSRLIAKAEGELCSAQQEYAAISPQIEAEKEIATAQNMLQSVLWMAEEFEMANLPRKRMILSQLIDKIELGSG